MKRSDLKGLGPIVVVIALSVGFHFVGDALFGDRIDAIAAELEALVASLGFLGYVVIVAAYAFCSFFFVPLLIPLNIASGALYGPYVGTAVALASISAGAAASAISVRHVFTGMQRLVKDRAGAERIREQVGAYGSTVVVVVRLAFIVPYLWQNIMLALSPIALDRLVILTAIGALPGAAVYALLGAGLVAQESVTQLTIYLGLAIVLFAAIALGVKYLRSRYPSGDPF